MRHWLITSTTYGAWLPGDRRGFVSTVRVDDGPRQRHNEFDTPYDADMSGLRATARALMKGPPVLLTAEKSAIVLSQLRETCTFRNWELHAAAIMANHFHAVVSAEERVRADTILRDLKSYASRVLNQKFGKPEGGTWWTESGSRRPLPNQVALENAMSYVRKQEYVLALYVATESPERGASAP